MLTLSVLSGLPGAGKTTYALRLGRTNQATIISRDDIRVHFPELGENGLTIKLVQLAASFLKNQISVIVDSRNLDPVDRVRWIELANLNKAELRWISLRTPTMECVRRDSRRPSPVGEAAITKMAHQYSLNL